MTNSPLIDRDWGVLGREAHGGPLEVLGSEGSWLIARDGRYLDFTMGWCVGNAGWGNRQILEALRRFDGPAYVHPNYLYERWVVLAEKLQQIVPVNGPGKCFRATGGTEAVEIALQAARAHTHRAAFLSVEGSYHGHSFGTMSVGSSGFKNSFGEMVPGCYKGGLPLDEKAARQAEQLLETRTIAAVIAEPIICNLGVYEPEQAFWGIVAEACRRTGTVMIMDEVATGFGRTGKMFACEHYGLRPDIITLGKGLSSGYGALGAAVMSPGLAKSMEFLFSSYSTFGWLPICVEAAIANVDYIVGRRLWENAETMGQYLKAGIAKIPFKSPVKVSGQGLALAVKFEDSGYAAEVARRALARKLIVADIGNNPFLLFPALEIDRKTADEALSVLAQST